MLNPNFEFSSQENKNISEVLEEENEDILEGSEDYFSEKEDNERNNKELEIQNKLIEEGKKYGNDFVFVEPKIKLKESELPKKINPKIFNRKTNPSFLKALEAQFEHLKRFISSSIIKDSFSSNHYERREWSDKYLKLLSPESQKCYHDNRLAFKNAAPVGTLLNLLEFLSVEEDMNQEMIDKLNNAAKLIPEAIVRSKDEIYAGLSEEEKIETMEDLAPVVKNFIEILGEPKNE